jgi:uncharacterized protein (DUF302 family)
MVARVLREKGLRTSAEVDVTARLRNEICANVAPCMVLFVDDPTLLLEGMMFYRGAALYIPQPLLISGTGHRTEVHIRSQESSVSSGLPSTVQKAIVRVHDRMMNAIDAIGELVEAGLRVHT